MSDNETLDALSFTFDRDRLNALAGELSASYQTAEPFPHTMVDEFLPSVVVEQLLAEFPDPTGADWQRFARSTEVKLALADTTQMGPVTRHVLAEFNGQVFVEFLENLTGISGLIVDHTYSGGGLHQIRPGGFLRVHADFNQHQGLRLDRRLNALLYLNSDWSESFGGHIELWDEAMQHKVKSYLPICNRLVVFSTTDTSYHGHPDPLSCPPDRARQSLALYYYTNGRPESEASNPHTTIFRQRPGERFTAPVSTTLSRWVPPALVDLARRRRS